jgi:hypothetical protein
MAKHNFPPVTRSTSARGYGSRYRDRRLLVGAGLAWLCFAIGVYFFTRTGREGMRIARLEEAMRIERMEGERRQRRTPSEGQRRSRGAAGLHVVALDHDPVRRLVPFDLLEPRHRAVAGLPSLPVTGRSSTRRPGRSAKAAVLRRDPDNAFELNLNVPPG